MIRTGWRGRAGRWRGRGRGTGAPGSCGQRRVTTSGIQRMGGFVAALGTGAITNTFVNAGFIGEDRGLLFAGAFDPRIHLGRLLAQPDGLVGLLGGIGALGLIEEVEGAATGDLIVVRADLFGLGVAF